MADKYRVRSVKTTAHTPDIYKRYIDTFTDWTELELYPYLGPTMAAVGGFDASFKILISPKTYAELKPARGDIINLDPTTFMRAHSADMNERPITQHPIPGTTYGIMSEILAQLKRLNNNLEKKT